MSCLLGIDLGTSSVKVVVFGVEGRLKAVGVAEYPTLTPHFGYAEQNPEDWWRATVTAVREALRKADYPEILPKDFLRFKLTGELGTDETDAAGSGIFHVGQRVWAGDVIERLELPRSIFPKVHASADVVGPLTKKAAMELGLPHGIPVSAGCADQPAQAVGNGLIDPPVGSVTIGTGGQIFVPLTKPIIDSAFRIHTFCHAPQARWYLLGAMLSAGMALRWLRTVLEREKTSYEDLVQLAPKVEPGSEGLLFLPYLVGERSPNMDPKAKAGFIGLTLRHGPAHFVRALLEGVAFALRQIVDTMVGCGADLTRLVASGNGLANPIWRQIVADILNRPLCQGTGDQASERGGVGAAMIAGIGSGIFADYEDAQKLAPVFNIVTPPNEEHARRYEACYSAFLELYPRLKGQRAS